MFGLTTITTAQDQLESVPSAAESAPSEEQAIQVADTPRPGPPQPNDEKEASEQSSDESDMPDIDELELASKLLAAQKQVALLKREDFVGVGTASTVRPKFEEALKEYNQLRDQVMILRERSQERLAKRDGWELEFNGVTSFVELPTLKYDGEVPYTIEAIVSPKPITGFRVNPETHSYSHYMAIVTDTEFGGIELGLQPDRYSFDVRALSPPPDVKRVGRYVKVESPTLPFTRLGVHIAAVLEADEIRLYENGRCVGRERFGGPIGTSPFTMRIGCSPHPVTQCHEMFCGRIDEVRFSKSARYKKDYEPVERLTSDDDTVALYHFDEGKGNEVRDASGNGHHGKIYDGRWVLTGDAGKPPVVKTASRK